MIQVFLPFSWKEHFVVGKRLEYIDSVKVIRYGGYAEIKKLPQNWDA